MNERNDSFHGVIKTVVPAFIHHTHEIKIYGGESGIYLEMKF